MRAIGFVVVFLTVADYAAAEVFFVGKAGAPGNPGTEAAPLATIQEGVDRCKPGDECIVLPGVYRESVRLANSGSQDAPICIRAKGEAVVDGTDTVTGQWERHEGAIYRIPLPGPTVEQAFSQGMPLAPARWPNARFEEMWIRSKWAGSAKGSKKDLMMCDALAKTGIDWTGAIAVLNVGHQYKTWTRDILTHGRGKNSFTYALDERLGDGKDLGPSWWDDRFYITGSLDALDAPGEWFHDADAGHFYLATRDGNAPPPGSVQVKRRAYGFECSNLTDLHVDGFRLFACALSLDSVERTVVKQCEIRFPSCTTMIGETMPAGQRSATPVTGVSGNDNRLEGLYVAYASGAGIQVAGSRNRVEDCIVHDVCWSGTINYAGITVTPRGSDDTSSTVSHCTVYNVGNIGISYRGGNNVVEYNHVHHTGLACHDIAAIHTGSPRTAGSTARYNWVHHSTGKAIRGDDQTRELTVHHNLVWDCDEGIIVKGDRNKVYNNTILGSGGHGVLIIPTRREPKKWWTKHEILPVQNTNSLFFNNYCEVIAYRLRPLPDSEGISHNVTYGKGAPFGETLILATGPALAAARLDPRPRQGTELVDAGRTVVGLTDGFKGSAPDVGAFESGSPIWQAGALRPEPEDFALPTEAEVARSWGLAAQSGRSIPIPTQLRESDLSNSARERLQELYNTCWQPDEIQRRREAIERREGHPAGSEEYSRHHAIVVKLHQTARQRLIEKAPTVLKDSELKRFQAIMK